MTTHHPSLHVPATRGKVVVLNGFPGTGKLTILQQAKALFPENTVCLLDNHLLIDPVEAVVPGRSDEHHALRRQVRAPVFAKLAERAREGCVVFMTACLAEDSAGDAAFLEEHLDMVRGTDVPIFWVNAHCDPAVLEQRLTSAGRCNGSKTKLRDVNVLRDLLRKHRLIVPGRVSDDSSVLLSVGTLDVSGSVDESVSLLMYMVNGVGYNLQVDNVKSAGQSRSTGSLRLFIEGLTSGNQGQQASIR